MSEHEGYAQELAAAAKKLHITLAENLYARLVGMLSIKISNIYLRTKILTFADIPYIPFS